MALSSELQISGPEWAHGCEACKFGMIAAPEPVPMLPLFECRAIQAAEEMILFCDCRAGYMQRQYLRKVYDKISMASRKNLREIVMAAHVPTVHFATEGAATP